MAVVPSCSLCRYVNRLKLSEKYRIPFLKFSVFLILLSEIITNFLRNKIDYACYYYPLVTQIDMFIIFISLFLWREKLRFCQRKSTTAFFLSVYYLFGAICIVAKFSNSFYTDIISNGLLALSVWLFFVSFLKK